MNTVIQTRVDANTRKGAESILAGMGFTLNEGIRIFLRQIVNTRSFPFKPELGDYPNTDTQEVIAKTNAGKDIEVFESMDNLIKDIQCK